MIAVAYQRSSERFELKAPVMLEDFRTGFYYDGIMYNYSADGIYLESDYAPRPGRKIRLKVDGLPDISAPQVYVAEIRWRCPLSENSSSYSYGVGVKYR
jgi:hypothetical protein